MSAIRNLSCNWLAWILAIPLLGCGDSGSVEKSVDTGSRNAVNNFFNGLIEKKWSQSYDQLSPEGKKKNSLEQFTRKATSWRKNLGFEPQSVFIQSCEERPNEAIAHVSIIAASGSQRTRFKEAISLTRQDQNWYIVLPNNFGQRTH
jgi:hypothetical protein